MNREERRSRPLDRRVVYGAKCSWWDSISKVAKTPSGLPCCPHCGNVLMEVPTEGAWWIGVDKHAQNEPGYREFIEWSRGRCFPNTDAARAAYEAATA